MTMSPMIVNQTQFTFSQCVWEAGSGDGGGGGGRRGGGVRRQHVVRSLAASADDIINPVYCDLNTQNVFLNSLTSKEQTTKILSANFPKKKCPI